MFCAISEDGTAIDSESAARRSARFNNVISAGNPSCSAWQHAGKSVQRLQVSHQVMNVFVRVLAEEFDMRIDGRVDGILHTRRWPRMIRPVPVAQADNELILILQCPRNLLAGRERNRHAALGVAR